MAKPNLSNQAIMKAIPELESLGGLIPAGGQKNVYPCVINGTQYALKILIPPDMTDKDQYDAELVTRLARAERELRILEACDSPHLVKVGPIPLTIKRISGRDFALYTEEWVVGTTLSELLRTQGYLSIADTINLAKDIASAIAAIAALKKVHRDIKPDNIIQRSSTSQYVLLDLGLTFDLDDKSLTRPGAIVGTPGFVSPEQLDLTQRRDIDFRSDLFLLGLVIYVAATGRHPFLHPGDDIPMVHRRIIHDRPAPPRRLRPDISQELDDIIMRLLGKTPARRYRDCQLLISALEGAGK